MAALFPLCSVHRWGHNQPTRIGNQTILETDLRDQTISHVLWRDADSHNWNPYGPSFVAYDIPAVLPGRKYVATFHNRYCRATPRGVKLCDHVYQKLGQHNRYP